MNPFESYQRFLAYKQHFTRKSYDFFKYNGKVNVRVSNFNMRKDKYHFYKLSKRDDIDGLIISNLVENKDLWITDLFTDKAYSIYTDWKKRKDSMTYQFQTEIDGIENSWLTVKDGQHPIFLTKFIRKAISPETMIVLDSYTSFLSHWHKKISDNIFWPDVYFMLNKYRPFVKYDAIKCKKILVDALN